MPPMTRPTAGARWSRAWTKSRRSTPAATASLPASWPCSTLHRRLASVLRSSSSPPSVRPLRRGASWPRLLTTTLACIQWTELAKTVSKTATANILTVGVPAAPTATTAATASTAQPHHRLHPTTPATAPATPATPTPKRPMSKGWTRSRKCAAHHPLYCVCRHASPPFPWASPCPPTTHHSSLVLVPRPCSTCSTRPLSFPPFSAHSSCTSAAGWPSKM